MTDKKIKVLTIGDMPLSTSGVGIQSRYIIEALLKTGRYEVVSLGGAIKHKEYEPIKTEEFGDDWVLFPVNGFGNDEMIRSIIVKERPDILWFMTDPRFFGWLWQMEDEIRPLMPMVYYHVWDNYPYPTYNRPSYLSNDVIVAISKLTHDIVQNVTPEVESHYIPHAVDTTVYKNYGAEFYKQNRKEAFSNWGNDKFLFFWNNRNARRKMSGSVLWWFKEFLDKVGHDKAMLLMHTDPHDPNGPNLEAILSELGLINGEVMFSSVKIDPMSLATIYNMADCVINISDAEGFGLSTLEALSCEKPIITTMTGGLQEQVTDGKNWFGVGIEPSSKALIGSQQVPFIYEDRIGKEDFLNAMLKIFNSPKEELEKMGTAGRAHVVKNYNFEDYQNNWIKLMDEIHEKHGSWSTRKNYNCWELKEVA